MTPAYAETTAWIVTGAAGLASGAILGTQHHLTLAAMLAVSAIAGSAVAACRHLIRVSRGSAALE